MKILNITSVFVPAQNTHMIVGLGKDNKTYVWSPTTGEWIPNWDKQQIELTKLRKKVLTKKPVAKKKVTSASKRVAPSRLKKSMTKRLKK